MQLKKKKKDLHRTRSSVFINTVDTHQVSKRSSTGCF